MTARKIYNTRKNTNALRATNAENDSTVIAAASSFTITLDQYTDCSHVIIHVTNSGALTSLTGTFALTAGLNVALNREVLQTIYPYMWNQYVQTKLQSVQGKNLSIEEKRSLNFTLGLENQDFTLPSIINNAINPIEANQAQQPNKPVSSPSANTGETSRIQRP